MASNSSCCISRCPQARWAMLYHQHVLGLLRDSPSRRRTAWMCSLLRVPPGLAWTKETSFGLLLSLVPSVTTQRLWPWVSGHVHSGAAPSLTPPFSRSILTPSTSPTVHIELHLDFPHLPARDGLLGPTRRNFRHRRVDAHVQIFVPPVVSAAGQVHLHFLVSLVSLHLDQQLIGNKVTLENIQSLHAKVLSNFLGFFIGKCIIITVSLISAVIEAHWRGIRICFKMPLGKILVTARRRVRLLF